MSPGKAYSGIESVGTVHRLSATGIDRSAADENEVSLRRAELLNRLIRAEPCDDFVSQGTGGGGQDHPAVFRETFENRGLLARDPFERPRALPDGHARHW